MGCKYVAVVELKNADANGVIASINTGMVEFGLENWKSQTVAFGSDGASVYVGRLNGVVAKLRVEIPWLLGVHCIAHRLSKSPTDVWKPSCTPVMMKSFMLDVMAVLKALSLLFQRDNIVISAAKDGLYSTELQLRAMIARSGKNLLDFLDGVDGNIYKGVTLTRMPNDLNAFIRDKKRIINTITQFLNSRFESLDSDPVLAAGKIFDPRVWPESVEDLATYGEAALERNDFDFAAVAGEWSALKACVTANNSGN